ncbi:MAG: hypothetical protein ABJG68_10435 [Crocinitomicaceae bacterium]
MIFADFEKIHFTLLGFDLVEPMALITDSILGTLSIILAFKVKKFKANHPFFEYWFWFFLIFGVGAFYGGLAHAFFNYWGVLGKFPSWIAGPVSIYMLEQAMIAASKNNRQIKILKGISFWKFVLVMATWVILLCVAPVWEKPSIGFLPIAINTIVGVSLAAGFLAHHYVKKGMSQSYRYFKLGVLVMLPSAFIFLMKINLHPWFDKNDLSHVLLAAGIIYFFIGCKNIYKEGINQDAYL